MFPDVLLMLTVLSEVLVLIEVAKLVVALTFNVWDTSAEMVAALPLAEIVPTVLLELDATTDSVCLDVTNNLLAQLEPHVTEFSVCQVVLTTMTASMVPFAEQDSANWVADPTLIVLEELFAVILFVKLDAHPPLIALFQDKLVLMDFVDSLDAVQMMTVFPTSSVVTASVFLDAEMMTNVPALLQVPHVLELSAKLDFPNAEMVLTVHHCPPARPMAFVSLDVTQIAIACQVQFAETMSAYQDVTQLLTAHNPLNVLEASVLLAVLVMLTV